MRVEPGWNGAADPVLVVGRKARPGDDVIGGGRKPRDGEVALDAAARVEELRVDEAAGGPRDIVGADPGQGALGVAADEVELRERGLVEHRHRSRTARCSRATASNQFGRPKVYRSAAVSPGAAKKFGRSQPSFSPKQAPCAFRRS